MEQNRPFFSIIVPCYNSRKTIGRLLESVYDQKLTKEDIEVIISDDCSTESYQDVLDEYKDKLWIKQTKTEYNCCPGNTRQAGVNVATGQWLGFADHDDEFIPGALAVVKEQIEKNNVKYFYATHFIKILKDREHYVEMNIHGGWTHGKFFNYDNLWKPYHLSYIKDLKSHEDISLTSQITYLQRTHPELVFHESNITSYKWYENTNSLSNKQYETADGLSRTFIDAFFLDYVASTAGVYYNNFTRDGKPYEYRPFIGQAIANIMLYAYFYLEFALTITPVPIQENVDCVYRYLHILNDEFDWTLDDIYRHFRLVKPEDYATIFKSSANLVGFMLQKHSFKEFLDIMYNKKRYVG